MERLLFFNSEKPLNTEIGIQISSKNFDIPGLHRSLERLKFLNVTSWRISNPSINNFSMLIYMVSARYPLIIFC